MRHGHRWQSKYLTIDPKNPDAFGVCDLTGFVFNHKDLVKQMEWRGNNYIWTGQLRGPQFIDAPQEQNRPPLAKADPKPVLNPRPTIPNIDLTFPEVTPNPQLINKLKSEVCWDDDKLPDVQQPNDSYQAPPYPQLLAKLNKINWNQ